MLRIAIATVNAKEPLQRTVIQRHIGQATHVHDIIDIRMGRVKANKTIDGSLC
ncbi:IS4 ORF [Shigella sonnei]|nr:IS4 ORF [Shigella sonnei]